MTKELKEMLKMNEKEKDLFNCYKNSKDELPEIIVKMAKSFWPEELEANELEADEDIISYFLARTLDNFLDGYYGFVVLDGVGEDEGVKIANKIIRTSAKVWDEHIKNKWDERNEEYHIFKTYDKASNFKRGLKDIMLDKKPMF